jgi:ubiquinone/menaquinone biosynthesis C-methylase UbiE
MPTTKINPWQESLQALGRLLACPVCKAPLAYATDRLTCVRCRREYPLVGEGVIDFLSASNDISIYWDEAAQEDEIYAAAALPKQKASGIFVKISPMLKDFDFNDKVCIDLGCGYGRTLIYTNINGKPAVSIGIDISRSMIDKSREYSKEYHVNPVLIRADISILPLQRETIDIVYSSAVLLHLSKEVVVNIIREIERVLKDGGTAIFENSFVGWINPDGLQTKMITKMLSKWLEPTWVRTYSYREVHRLFTQIGKFRKVEIAPENYKILPKVFLTYSLPEPVKKWVNMSNEWFSQRISFKDLFVAGWSVKIQK